MEESGKSTETLTNALDGIRSSVQTAFGFVLGVFSDTIRVSVCADQGHTRQTLRAKERWHLERLLFFWKENKQRNDIWSGIFNFRNGRGRKSVKCVRKVVKTAWRTLPKMFAKSRSVGDEFDQSSTPFIGRSCKSPQNRAVILRRVRCYRKQF